MAVSKIKRVFMQIKRGLTDTTPSCCFPWEKPLLESIHGGNAVEVSIDTLVGTQGAASVKPIPLPRQDEKTVRAPDARAQYEAMLAVDEGTNPLSDPGQEWNRLIEKYGMDAELPISVAEKVYGNYRQFRAALRDFAEGRVPDFLAGDDSEPIEADAERSPADMTYDELKAEIKRRGLTLPSGNAKKADLVDMLTEAMAEAA